MKEALDLCLSCKGCKGDCPVNVDMATYKAEFLAHHSRGHVCCGRPLYDYGLLPVDRVHGAEAEPQGHRPGSLPSGCCGMAGSFGFEDGEKYRVSVAEAWRVLLSAVRDAEPTTLVIADGFSCKTQIEQSTNRHALHLAQVLDLALREGKEGPATHAPPEQVFARPARRRGVRRSVVRAGALVLAGAATVALVGNRPRRRLARGLLRK